MASEGKWSMIYVESMCYHLNREEGSQTLKYRQCHGIAKEASSFQSNKCVRLISADLFCVVSFGFRCQMVGAVTEGCLGVEACLSVFSCVCKLIVRSLLCMTCNATHPSDPLNLLEYMSFSTTLSSLDEASATKSRSHWRWRVLKTNSHTCARRYFQGDLLAFTKLKELQRHLVLWTWLCMGNRTSRSSSRHLTGVRYFLRQRNTWRFFWKLSVASGAGPRSDLMPEPRQSQLFKDPFLKTVENYCPSWFSDFLRLIALCQGAKDIFPKHKCDFRTRVLNLHTLKIWKICN